MPKRRAAFIHSEEIEQYSYPADCPFRPERAGGVRKTLYSMGLLTGAGISEVAPEPADRRVVKKFHSGRYLHALKNAARGRWDVEALHMGIGTEDCPIFKGLYDYAMLATGGTLAGAELLLADKADVVFNPSGGYHHAFPEKAGGFCYINDNAIASMFLAEAGQKVLYLDVDVHHGDGVAFGFYDRSDVMTISLHENPKTLFPGTGYEDEIGEGEGKGYCVNLPLPVGTYDEAYMKAFDAIVLPLTGAFNPDVIVFELGADTLAGDPLAHLHMTNNSYVEIISRLLSFERPILMTGGGGYNVENTVRAWSLAWTILAGVEDDHDYSAAIGGVMMESTDWQGGLRDRELPVTEQQRSSVMPAVDRTIEEVKKRVFSLHGI
ncbi:MAG: acetoin utilization protein AcuC [Phycisphaerales bacterium]|nr:MAG: acetoin utilization protein AcuC [Phycisphaerales bacterium]